MRETHGLYVGVESRPRFLGDDRSLKSRVKDLSPAERKEGWMIAPIRVTRAFVPARTKPSPLWLSVGAGIVVFLVFLVSNLLAH